MTEKSMIKETYYNGKKSITLENDKISVTVILSQGGKIASFKYKKNNFELLFDDCEKSKDDFLPFDNFEKSAWGFDDAFPNIDEEEFVFNGEKIKYPDHGEVWTLGFDYRIENDKLILRADSRIFDYTFEKTLSLCGEKLKISYNIMTKSENPFPCMWTMHCLIHCENDMKLMYPKTAKKLMNVRYDSKYLGNFGTVFDYPSDKYNFDAVFDKSANKCEKVYVANEFSDGVCGAYYPKSDMEFKTYFDTEILKYLGFWVTEGGFRGDYNCAMEPSTGFFDKISIADKNNSLFYLTKDNPLKFEIELELKKGNN